MTNERAIEKRKQLVDYLKYSLEIGSDCCLLDEDKKELISALEYRIPKKPISLKADKDIKIGAGTWKKGVTVYKCLCCNNFISRSSYFCNKCGQAIDRT